MNDLLNIIGAISNVIATGLAALSIYITIVDHKNTRREDRRKTIAEQDLNWYNEVALNDIIKNLTLFVDESEQVINDCKQVPKELLQNELETSYNSIKYNFKSLSIRVLLLKIFSESLYRKCNETLQNVLDLYSDVINTALEKKFLYNYNEVKIQEKQVQMIKELYNYKRNFTKED